MALPALRSLLPASLPALGALLVAACASPLGGEELELAGGFVAGPGLGTRLELTQRMLERPGRYDLHLEASYTHQALGSALDAAGRRADAGWDQVSAGLRVTTTPGGPAPEAWWFGRAGATWGRARGDPVFLNDPGDYGGIHVGVGYRRRLGAHLSTGPELTLLGLLPEGGSNRGGVVPQLSWSLAWDL